MHFEANARDWLRRGEIATCSHRRKNGAPSSRTSCTAPSALSESSAKVHVKREFVERRQLLLCMAIMKLYLSFSAHTLALFLSAHTLALFLSPHTLYLALFLPALYLGLCHFYLTGKNEENDQKMFFGGTFLSILCSLVSFFLYSQW